LKPSSLPLLSSPDSRKAVAVSGAESPVSEATRTTQRRAHALIPGGAHTYAKGDDQYPENAPPFIVRGSGCYVWDTDGRRFIEYGMGLRAVTLGHAEPRVIAAVHEAMLQGSNFTRPSPLELQCAEEFLGAVPGAEMVKFAKNGSDVTTAALKLARAYTGRDMVAVCADHSFFSVDDWFIGSTPVYAGIPQIIRDLTVKFRYNDPSSLEQVFQDWPGRIACVVLEPETTVSPQPGYFAQLEALCRKYGALLVLDELITGFRWHLGGAQTLYDIHPDLSAFGKAMGNGFAIAALAGRREIMQLGGLDHDRERVFLLSTTHGAESVGLAAAIETIRIYRQEGIIDILRGQGTRLKRGVDAEIAARGLSEYVQVLGHPSNLVFATRDGEKKPSQPFRTLFMQELIRGGVLGPSFVISAAHGDEEVDQTVLAVGQALTVYARALEDGVEQHLVGRPTKPVYRTYN
jgi:glutamate-1-semialdehyde 2,1-aminomutase